MSDRCKCGAHISTVWNFATCPVCEKLELREEITRLKALLWKARDDVVSCRNVAKKTSRPVSIEYHEELLADIDEVLGDE